MTMNKDFEKFGASCGDCRWFRGTMTIKYNKWMCPMECGGAMEIGGMVWLTHPPGNHHVCKTCGFKAALRDLWITQNNASKYSGATFQRGRAIAFPKKETLQYCLPVSLQEFNSCSGCPAFRLNSKEDHDEPTCLILDKSLALNERFCRCPLIPCKELFTVVESTFHSDYDNREVEVQSPVEKNTREELDEYIASRCELNGKDFIRRDFSKMRRIFVLEEEEDVSLTYLNGLPTFRRRIDKKLAAELDESIRQQSDDEYFQSLVRQKELAELKRLQEKYGKDDTNG